jgi:anthranilate phosphoribosyltransferase
MIKEALSKAIGGTDLTEEECKAAMTEIMEGNATDAQIGGFLVALRVKGETVDEIVAGARVMREKVSRVDVGDLPVLIDTCGTGGDGSETYNVSTVAAVIAAAGGAAVAKHGNRSVSSSSGSADVLKTLGVNIEKQPDEAARSIREVNFGFLFAPLYHGAMKYAIGPRREMGVRTLFNVLGPLTNPAGVTRQVMGVYSGMLVEPIANVLLRLGAEKALVVHSDDGLDEISPAAPTRIAEASGGGVKMSTISPSDFDLETGSLDAVKVASAEESAEMIRKVFAGEQGAPRTAALLNGGAALYVAGTVDTLGAGVKRAAELVDSGAAAKQLEAIIQAG